MILIDTGAFVAFYRSNDQHHREAAKLWPSIKPPFVVTNHIIDELATGLGRLAGFEYACDRIEDVHNSPLIDILYSTRHDEADALVWMRKFAHQKVSFTDCVSFAVMRRRKIGTAFTFDRHFRMAGFGVIGLK